jgi:hypothetical protein
MDEKFSSEASWRSVAAVDEKFSSKVLKNDFFLSEEPLATLVPLLWYR